MKFRYRWTWTGDGRIYVFQHGQSDVDYTIHLFYQLIVTFTVLNMLGAPLAAFANLCILRIWNMSKTSVRN